MKYRRGLALGLGLALSLQSVVVFANDVSPEAAASTSAVIMAIDGAAQEEIDKEPAIEGPVLEEPAIEEPVLEEPAIEEPAIEEPVLEEPAIEEPAIEEPVLEEPAIEEPVLEEPAIEEPAVEVAPEVKANATLLITSKLMNGDKEIVFQDEITDLVAGETVDIAQYVSENKDVKAVNGSGTIELAEGLNEVVIEYRFVQHNAEENNKDAVEEVYAGELTY